jgi:hypothetical protein
MAATRMPATLRACNQSGVPRMLACLVTLKSGDSGHVLPKQVHDDKNASPSKPVKFLVFHVTEKGQPLAVPVR